MKRFFTTYAVFLETLFVFVLVLLPIVAGAQGIVTPASGDTKTLDNPLGVNSFCGLVIKLVQAVTVIGIPVAVLFIVWAGLKFVLAQGNSGELAKAKTNFYYVIIGIAIFVGATLIANVVVNTLKQLGVKGLNSCDTGSYSTNRFEDRR